MYPVEHETTAAPAVNLMALLGKNPCTPAGKAARTNTPAGQKHERSTVCKAARTNTPAGQKHERSTVCRGAGDIAPEVVPLSRTDWPSSCHPWQKTLWSSG